MKHKAIKLKSHFAKAEDSPGFMLWKASNLLQRLHAQALKGLKVTPTQFSLMTCLVYLNQSEPVTAARIVVHTGMDKMMVSDLLKTLEKKNYLRRKINPKDARSSLIAPTAIGERVTNLAVKKIEELDREFFKKTKDIRVFHSDLKALITD